MRGTPGSSTLQPGAGGQGLLGQIKGRTSACVVDWLRQRTPEFRAAVQFVAIDPAAVYAKAIRTVLDDGSRLLPNACYGGLLRRHRSAARAAASPSSPGGRSLSPGVSPGGV